MSVRQLLVAAGLVRPPKTSSSAETIMLANLMFVKRKVRELKRSSAEVLLYSVKLLSTSILLGQIFIERDTDTPHTGTQGKTEWK